MLDARRGRSRRRPRRLAGPVSALLTTLAVVGGALSGPAASAAAEPGLSPRESDYLSAVRGNFPGDDETLLLVGQRICHMLYTGESPSEVVAVVAAEYGAGTDQTDGVLRVARDTLCAA